MKTTKTLLSAIALTCTLLIYPACNPDEKAGQAKITVNTAAIYDELGITDLMKNSALGSQGFTIVDTLLIYDQQGLLVSRQGVEGSSLQPVTFEATGLPEGNYTFVAWQSARSNEFGTPWHCSGEDKLATASIVTSSTCMSYQFSVGLAMGAAAVGGGQVELELVPKSLGCIVDLWGDNFPEEHKNEYLYLERTSQPVPCGMRIDPAISEDDRWILAEEGNLVIAYVETSDPRYIHFTLAHTAGEPFYFWTWYGQDDIYAGELPNVTMNSGEYYVCYNDLENRTWVPPFFGAHDAFDVWKADRDAGILVADPVLDWGCNFDKVERHIKAKQWWKPGNDAFEYWEDEYGSWHRWYYVADKLTEQYLFETENGDNLRYALCCTWDTTLPVEVAKNSLLKQGYIYKGMIRYPEASDTGDCFLSPDGKTQAEVYLYDDGCWEIEYQPVNPDSFIYISDKAPAAKNKCGIRRGVPESPQVRGSIHPKIATEVSKYHF